MAKKKIVNEDNLNEVAGGKTLEPQYNGSSAPAAGLADPDKYPTDNAGYAPSGLPDPDKY